MDDCGFITCIFCNKMYRTLGSLKSHIKIHSTDEFSKEMYKIISLLRVRHNGEDKGFNCPACEKSYKTQTDIFYHWNYKHRFKHFEVLDIKPLHNCFHCDKKFHQKRILHGHIRTEHRDMGYPCELCGRHFKSDGALERHKSTHLTDSPFECEKCQLQFCASRSLKTHVESLCKCIDQPYLCGTCGRAFASEMSLTAHKKLHGSDKVYLCSTCGKGFPTPGSLNSHNESHTRGFICTLCGKRLARADGLKEHMKIHDGTEDKKHKCSVCSAGFVTKKQLSNHMGVHATETPYTCDVCHKSFKLLRYLKQHQVIHRNRKLLQCPDCDKTFLHAFTLRNHRKDRHPHLTSNTSTDDRTLEPRIGWTTISKNMVAEDALHLLKHQVYLSNSQEPYHPSTENPGNPNCIEANAIAQSNNLYSGHDVTALTLETGSDDSSDWTKLSGTRQLVDVSVEQEAETSNSASLDCNTVPQHAQDDLISMLNVDSTVEILMHSVPDTILHDTQGLCDSPVKEDQQIPSPGTSADSIEEHALTEEKYQAEQGQKKYKSYKKENIFLICEICNAMFKRQACFKRHVIRHTTEKFIDDAYKKIIVSDDGAKGLCPECSAPVKSAKLVKHWNRKHRLRQERPDPDLDNMFDEFVKSEPATNATEGKNQPQMPHGSVTRDGPQSHLLA